MSAPTASPRLVVLDSDPKYAREMAAALGTEVVACDHPGRLPELLDPSVDLVVGEIGVREEWDGLEALARVRETGVGVVVWSSRNVEDILIPARHAEIGVLLTKTEPLQFDEISMVRGILRCGLSDGVAKYLGRGSVRLGKEQISGLEQVGALCRHVQAGLEAGLASSRRLRLVLDELLSNAIHHSGAASASLEWGHDGLRHVFCVRDHAGSLDPLEALRLLDRHIRCEGLLDPRGRGLHLSRIYADRLYATVVPGDVTEVAGVFWTVPGAFQGAKPVWLLKARGPEGREGSWE